MRRDGGGGLEGWDTAEEGHGQERRVRSKRERANDIGHYGAGRVEFSTYRASLQHVERKKIEPWIPVVERMVGCR